MENTDDDFICMAAIWLD